MIELLAPAGNLEKLKIAVLYGADAVFIGGKEFSLRSRASNFTLEDIKEGCEFAHKHNAKVHVTTNILPHNNNLDGLKEYLINLEKCGVDAIICASLYIMNTALKYTNLEVHVSTQDSIANVEAINFYKSIGCKRVVLAREVSLEELKSIRSKTDMDIEVFIHGGMCSSYSGRCMLSNEMSNRDANRGGCAHSCRWNYDLISDGKLINDGNYFSLASRDLCALKYIPDFIDNNITSLKIEGRMKSTHYIATVVNAYRRAIDEYYKFKTINFDKYDHMIKKAENRLTSIGFYNGDPGVNEHLYINFGEEPSQEYVGDVLDYIDGFMIMEVKNYFTIDDSLEIFSPKEELRSFKITEILNMDNEKVLVCNHPNEIVKIKVPFSVLKNDFVRKL